MFSISTAGVVIINRGDSASASIYLNTGTELNPVQFTFGNNDVVYFGIMENDQKFEDAIVKYKLTYSDLDTAGNVVLNIKATDTELLLPGKYFYQAKLVYIDSDNTEQITTVIPKNVFYVQE